MEPLRLFALSDKEIIKLIRTIGDTFLDSSSSPYMVCFSRDSDYVLVKQRYNNVKSEKDIPHTDPSLEVRYYYIFTLLLRELEEDFLFKTTVSVKISPENEYHLLVEELKSANSLSPFTSEYYLVKRNNL